MSASQIFEAELPAGLHQIQVVRQLRESGSAGGWQLDDMNLTVVRVALPSAPLHTGC